MVVTAPEVVRPRPRGRAATTRAASAAALGLPTPGPDTGGVEVTTALAVLREPPRRVRHLAAGAADHEETVRAPVDTWRPEPPAVCGIGPVAAVVVSAAWSRAGRSRSEAASAMLTGAAPIPASPGTAARYRLDRCRLDRCGDRRLDRALRAAASPHTAHLP